MLATLTRALAVPGALVLGSAFFLGHWLVLLLYGESYLPAIGPFYLHLMTALLGAVLFWSLPLVQSLEKVNARLVIMLIALVIGVTTAAALAPGHGAFGVAGASAASKIFILFALVWVCFNSREERIRSRGRWVSVEN